MKRIVSFVLMCLMVLSLNAQNDAKKVKITTDPGSKSELKVPGYVDLGLPSGTLWKNEDEEGLYSFYLAMSNFGDNLPSREQMEELRNSCEWKWTGKGYKVIGPNGSSIYLSASGYQDCNKEWNGVGLDSRVVSSRDYRGCYWSSIRAAANQDGSARAYSLGFNPDGTGIEEPECCCWLHIRLVKNK